MFSGSVRVCKTAFILILPVENMTAPLDHHLGTPNFL